MLLHSNEVPHILLITCSSGLSTNSCTHLQRDHVRLVLLPDAEVVHEELQHVEGLFFAHVQQQHSSYKADTLTVANLRGAKRKEHTVFTTNSLTFTTLWPYLQWCNVGKGNRMVVYVPLYPAESRLLGCCRGKAALHPAGLRSIGGWGRSGLSKESETFISINIY